MARTVEELKLGFARVEAAQACRNLMGKYSYFHTAMRNKDYVKLWAERPDDLLVLPWGYYRGIEGVRACYLQDHGDRSDPEIQNSPILKGGMMMHCMDTEVLEVAADGRTARGVWITPGTETAPAPGKEKGSWCWGKYEVEFIKEDGVWKFWKMTLFPLFLTPYDRSWGQPQLELEGTHELPDMGVDERLEKPFWQYGPDAIYPENEPAVPEPYDGCPGV